MPGGQSTVSFAPNPRPQTASLAPTRVRTFSRFTGGRGPRPNSGAFGATARFTKFVASVERRVENAFEPLELERLAADPYVD